MRAERGYPSFTITKKGEASLTGGPPWVYFDEITSQPDTLPQPGDLVDVLSQKGRWLGTGFYSPQSKIRIRVFSRNANDKFDKAFWERRLE